MIGKCFAWSCKRQVEFLCRCTTPETLMCNYHVKRHKSSEGEHLTTNISSDRDFIIKALNLEISMMIEIKDILTLNFEQSHQEPLRLKLLEIEESINRIEKIIHDYKSETADLNIDSSAIENIQKEGSKYKDYLADLILREKDAQIDVFLKKLYHLDDINLHCQLETEFLQISAFDKYDDYIISLANENTDIRLHHKNFIDKCKNIQLKLNNLVWKIHNQNYKDNNLDFNYLYNYDENLNGTEIYLYNIETGIRTSTLAMKSYRSQHRFLDSITHILKISNSHLLIIGYIEAHGEAFLMDIKTQKVNKLFRFWECDKSSGIIFYENQLYVFRAVGSKRYDINRHQNFELSFPKLSERERVVAMLFRNYILVTNWGKSNFYLYDLSIETHSEITFCEHTDRWKSLFTDNVRAYYGVHLGKLYESEENNPFKWNLIGNMNFGNGKSSFEHTFSIYNENIYISFLVRPKMYCFMFNKEGKKMKLIYEEVVNN